MRRSVELVAGNEIHFRGLAFRQRSSGKASQRWRAVGDIVPIRPARESNTESVRLATELTAELEIT